MSIILKRITAEAFSKAKHEQQAIKKAQRANISSLNHHLI